MNKLQVFARLVLVLTVASMMMLTSPCPGQGSLITVSTVSDENDGDYSVGDLSLREAILLASSEPGVGRIVFDPALTAGGPATIELAGSADELMVTGQVSIEGPGADLLTIDAVGQSRVMRIASAGSATIAGLQLTGGDVRSRAHLENFGGAVQVDQNGEASLNNVVIEGNKAYYGGGLYNAGGTLVLTGCRVVDNMALNAGGGIHTGYLPSNTTLADTSVEGNIASGWGGGGLFAHANANVVINCCLFSGNVADYEWPVGGGGAIQLYKSTHFEMANSTISGNISKTNGGGIHCRYADVIATLTNCTLAYNIADSNDAGVTGEGGGLSVQDSSVTLYNTIVADNRRGGHASPEPDDISGHVNMASCHNLVGAIDGSYGLETSGNIYGHAYQPLDPQIGPLADNGGLTLTHALTSTSPAIDAGDAAHINPACMSCDQRGCCRLMDGDGDTNIVCDIGAVEFALCSRVTLDDTDPDIQYTGTWIGQSGLWGRDRSTTHETCEQGAEASVAFYGCYVSLFAEQQTWGGEAEIYIDGQYRDTVSFHADSPDQLQKLIYHCNDLVKSIHELKIVAVGNGYVYLDKLCIAQRPIYQMTDDQNPEIDYYGQWTSQTGWGGRYMHSTHETCTSNAVASFHFQGTFLRLIGERQTWGGTAELYIDGLHHGRVSFHSSLPQLHQQDIFTAIGLEPGSHSAQLVANGDGWTYLDAVATSRCDLVTMDNLDDGMITEGEWFIREDDQLHNGSTHEAHGYGKAIEFTFTGTMISVIGERQPWGGHADIYIDGLRKGWMDFLSYNNDTMQCVVYTQCGLPAGEHTVRIVNRSNHWIYLDAVCFGQ